MPKMIEDIEDRFCLPFPPVNERRHRSCSYGPQQSESIHLGTWRIRRSWLQSSRQRPSAQFGIAQRPSIPKPCAAEWSCNLFHLFNLWQQKRCQETHDGNALVESGLVLHLPAKNTIATEPDSHSAGKIGGKFGSHPIGDISQVFNWILVHLFE